MSVMTAEILPLLSMRLTLVVGCSGFARDPSHSPLMPNRGSVNQMLSSDLTTIPIRDFHQRVQQLHFCRKVVQEHAFADAGFPRDRIERDPMDAEPGQQPRRAGQDALAQVGRPFDLVC